MGDTETTDTTTEPTEMVDDTTTDDGDTNDIEKMRAALRKANDEAKRHRLRVKELEPASARLKELEDADKSELERASERAADAEKRATDAEARALRLEVAAEKGLTAAQARRLVGATREEMEADADDLMDAFGTKPSDNDKTTGRTSTGRPRENLREGASPDGGETRSGEELAAEVWKRTHGDI